MVNSFDDETANWDNNPTHMKLVDEVLNFFQYKINFNVIHSTLDYGCGNALLGFKTIDMI